MSRLVAELRRLYLLDEQPYGVWDGDGSRWQPAGLLTAAALDAHLDGEVTVALDVGNPVEGAAGTRVVAIDFGWTRDSDGMAAWRALCAMAQALQQELKLPAPAVSITGARGYRLWLSLASPVAAAQAREFALLARRAWCAGDDAVDSDDDGGDGRYLMLAPGVHRTSGAWAAFINPGMGASFADESGLEMAPPRDAQAAFLDGLDSIGVEAFAQALDVLRQRAGAAAAVPAAPAPALSPVTVAAAIAPAGLLLSDATLEDIVRFLHAKNIEPTFRHLVPPARN